jgi:hypothetical protein
MMPIREMVMSDMRTGNSFFKAMFLALMDYKNNTYR